MQRFVLVRKMAGEERTGATMRPKTKQEMFSKMLRQLGASVFFGISSILIITVNKTVLTSYKSVQFLMNAPPLYTLY